MGQHCVQFVNGEVENFDAIILATGYKSNTPSWLEVPYIYFYFFPLIQLNKIKLYVQLTYILSYTFLFLGKYNVLRKRWDA